MTRTIKNRPEFLRPAKYWKNKLRFGLRFYERTRQQIFRALFNAVELGCRVVAIVFEFNESLCDTDFISCVLKKISPVCR